MGGNSPHRGSTEPVHRAWIARSWQVGGRSCGGVGWRPPGLTPLLGRGEVVGWQQRLARCRHITSCSIPIPYRWPAWPRPQICSKKPRWHARTLLNLGWAAPRARGITQNQRRRAARRSPWENRPRRATRVTNGHPMAQPRQGRCSKLHVQAFWSVKGGPQPSQPQFPRG
jgi:hypothetical protein